MTTPTPASVTQATNIYHTLPAYIDGERGKVLVINTLATALDAAKAEQREVDAGIVETWDSRELLYVRDNGGYEPDADAIAAAIRGGKP